MNYEQKYKEALEKLQDTFAPREDGRKISGLTREYIENIFPELKESDDERIRKELITFIKKRDRSGCDYDYDKWIAWLEKQDKKDPCIGCINDKGCVTCENGNLKEIKIEPKFKPGAWIITPENKVLHITRILGTAYEFNNESSYWEICYCDKECRLWTVKDAKDGDVLVCNINKVEIGGDVEKLPNITPTICIYQNVVKDKDYIHSYCSLYDGSSLVPQNRMYYYTFVYNIQPATEEQRELLFRKMKEAGYEWNAVKKEIRRIKK